MEVAFLLFEPSRLAYSEVRDVAAPVSFLGVLPFMVKLQV